jgi:tetratricopeptide (TPR) repeat protein
VQLGGLHERAGDLDKAEKQYNLALAERKNYPFALAALGRIHRKRGDLETAQAELERAITIMPDAHFYAELARIHKAAKNSPGYADAIAKAEQALIGLSATDPHQAHADAHTHGHSHQVGLEMARFELEFHKDLPVALQNAEHEFEHREGNIDVNATLAAIYCAKGEYGTARMHAGLASKTGSQDPALRMLDGLIAVKQGEAQGKALIREAFKADPWLQHPLAEEARAMM